MSNIIIWKKKKMLAGIVCLVLTSGSKRAVHENVWLLTFGKFAGRHPSPVCVRTKQKALFSMKGAKFDLWISYNCHAELDQALYYLIGNSIIRVIVLDGLPGNSTDRLLAMRPVPSYFVIFGDTENVIKLFKKVSIFRTQQNSNW
jgi:hypothetical protein